MAAGNGADDRVTERVEDILVQTPLKAAGFIVTIYGDVVEPRGGVVWIGNLIETCAAVGISETLVRTAVSRLVAAGQLLGEREGRRSYYRLSRAAGSEFASAARIIFGGVPEESWQLVHLTGAEAEERMQALERAGYARLDPRLAIGPARQAPASADALILRADSPDPKALAAFVEAYWNLAPHAAAYRMFLDQFAPVARLAQTRALAPATALTMRLLLIHRFRTVLLHDPRLPAAALPQDWPGFEARRLFAALYRHLSPSADGHIGSSFISGSGPLSAVTEDTEKRLADLETQAA
ncbi:phenylacetic acid degradation operon negative regulatory protein PaaX [Sinorhizobium sp. BJ1]|uniref:phenylacetic acid degradation operon negative regulatory protein PaaX n=1 Tax=Sinorhizobium sp. BJ1 TaxID=2035455 RepID=UPI000BE88388|nr:phenylacetic acid degradation operon negative regulatory protein PaaX [Sinorhizobium sp. BJ1]PDT83901.1 phenylacetic acid degradation operon negative regulatory protein PaaX [Sinorhizobium sp. BJ1]